MDEVQKQLEDQCKRKEELRKMRIPTSIFFKKLFGFIELRTGVILITVFALLNKISGFFGIPTIFYGGGFISIISYLYSIIITFVILYCLLNGILKENPTVIQLYSKIYWTDLIINIIFTITFGISWFYTINHSPSKITSSFNNDNTTTTSSDGDELLPIKKTLSWKKESIISVTCLVIVSIIHVYFALLVQSYSRFVSKKSQENLYNSRKTTSGTALLNSEDTNTSNSNSINVNVFRRVTVEDYDEESHADF
nr:12464_t:CDS:2 [Entrophospora candida]